MRMKLREVLAWLLATIALVVVVVFELVLWVGLALLLTAGLVYESGARLIRLLRPKKPIEQQCVHCEEQRHFTNPQLQRYLKRRGG